MKKKKLEIAISWLNIADRFFIFCRLDVTEDILYWGTVIYFYIKDIGTLLLPIVTVVTPCMFLTFYYFYYCFLQIFIFLVFLPFCCCFFSLLWENFEKNTFSKRKTTEKFINLFFPSWKKIHMFPLVKYG